MNELSPIDRAALAAYIRRMTHGTPDFHPARGDKIARRFPIVHAELTRIASRNRGYWFRPRDRIDRTLPA